MDGGEKLEKMFICV